MKKYFSSVFAITERNVKNYLRDRAGVFFSFLSPMIILALYIMFIGELQVSSITQTLSDAGLSFDQSKVKLMVDSWVMAGVLSLSIITIPLGVSGIIVMDRQKGKINDILTSPVSGTKILLGYFFAVFFVSLLLNLAVLVAIQILILISGGGFFMLIQWVQILGLLVLGLISVTFLILFIVLFLKTEGAYTGLSIMFGTLVAFFLGLYIPLNIMPEAFQAVANSLPFTHIGTMLKNVITGPLISSIAENPSPELIQSMFDNFSLNTYIFGTKLSLTYMLGYSFISVVVFFFLNMIHFSKFKKIK